MKLIDEKLVKDVCEKHALKTIKDLPTKDMRGEMSAIEWSCWFEDEFKAGVDFAEQQLKQEMIEFGRFCFNMARNPNDKTTTFEQLLEEFINQQK